MRVPGFFSLVSGEESLIGSGSQSLLSNHADEIGTSNASPSKRVLTSESRPILKIARFIPTPYMPMVSASASRSSSGSRPILNAYLIAISRGIPPQSSSIAKWSPDRSILIVCFE